MDRRRLLERVRTTQSRYHADVAVPDYPRIEKVVRLLRPLPPGRLLDVGYSKGSFADSLAQQGWRCVGLDLNPQRSPGVAVIPCDLNEGFPVGPETFDLVTAGEVIEHMLDDTLFLQECRRVLKKGGTLVLTTPNLAFWLNRLRLLFGSAPLFVTAPYHYRFYTLRTLLQLLRQEGLLAERMLSSHLLYSRRRHWSGRLFEWLGDLFPTFGAHLILMARKPE